MPSYPFRNTTVTDDDKSTAVVYLDRDAAISLIQRDSDHYELRKGRCLLAVVGFCNGQHEWGWRFEPCAARMQPSRKLHPTPEAAVGARFRIEAVVALARVEGKNR